MTEAGRAVIPAEPVELASMELHELGGGGGSDYQPLERCELCGSDPEFYELPGSDFVNKRQYLEVPQIPSRDAYDSPYRTANQAYTNPLPNGNAGRNQARLQVDEWVSSEEERREPGLVEYMFTEEGRTRDHIIHQSASLTGWN